MASQADAPLLTGWEPTRRSSPAILHTPLLAGWESTRRSSPAVINAPLLAGGVRAPLFVSYLPPRCRFIGESTRRTSLTEGRRRAAARANGSTPFLSLSCRITLFLFIILYYLFDLAK